MEEKREIEEGMENPTVEETVEETKEKKFCVQCGAELAEDQMFCSKCGHKVGEKLEPVKEVPAKKGNKKNEKQDI